MAEAPGSQEPQAPAAPEGPAHAMGTDFTSPPQQGEVYPSSSKGYHPEHLIHLPFSSHQNEPNFDLLERELGTDSGAFPNDKGLRFRYMNSNGAFCPPPFRVTVTLLTFASS